MSGDEKQGPGAEEQGPAEDPRALWQGQATELADVPLEAVRLRARRFERTLRFRDAREYVAGAGVAAVCLAGVARPGAQAFERAAALAALAGLGVVLFHLARHGRAQARAPAAGSPTSEHVAYLRARLDGQRALLASVWRWYLAPLVPAMLILFVGIAVSAPPAARARPGFWLVLGGVGAVVALVFAGVGRLNARGARKLEEEIRALE